jgi:hypothetical protein
MFDRAIGKCLQLLGETAALACAAFLAIVFVVFIGTFLMALMVGVGTARSAEPFLGASKDDYCATWASNAMYGASQRMRGARREVAFITKDVMLGMIEHGVGADRLYFLDRAYSASERDFLTRSVLAGYDAMDAAEKSAPGVTRDAEAWFGRFVQQCMNQPEPHASAGALRHVSQDDKPAHNDCAKPGGDCVKYLRDAGPVAFCQWAAATAGVGAHLKKIGQQQVRLNFPRPLTALERAEMDRWLAFGWQSDLEEYAVPQKAYDVCMREYI